jgi:hypothetical protein
VVKYRKISPLDPMENRFLLFQSSGMRRFTQRNNWLTLDAIR